MIHQTWKLGDLKFKDIFVNPISFWVGRCNFYVILFIQRNTVFKLNNAIFIFYQQIIVHCNSNLYVL